MRELISLVRETYASWNLPPPLLDLIAHNAQLIDLCESEFTFFVHRIYQVGRRERRLAIFPHHLRKRFRAAEYPTAARRMARDDGKQRRITDGSCFQTQ